MDSIPEPQEFTLPLELQFSMRKAEIQAQDMTWEELHSALLNLYHQRLLEWQAIKEIMDSENIKIDFDVPTELELAELAACMMQDDDDEEDDPFEAV
tara:strand:+ start:589 stop:879 length:291 start_codon:yes stop_codon:yes gene_type:complete